MILPFDELNELRFKLTPHLTESDDPTQPGRRRIKSEKDLYDIIDMMLDLFLLAYARGVEAVNEQLGTDFRPTTDEIEDTVYRPVKGATWVDRMWAWYESGGDEEDIMRIAETEAHRDGNTAADNTAKKAGATTKTWVCQMLPTSRDTHVYLDGTTVGIDDEFYSYTGAHTKYPGEFGEPDEDCNCLCELKYS